MGIRSLTALKKDHTQPKEIIEKDYLILGQEPIAAQVALLLNEKAKEFIWIGEKDFDLDILNQVSPSLLRTQDSIEAVGSLCPSVELQRVEKSPLFYKDQKFRKFGGRAKPVPLKKHEDFYLNKNWAYYSAAQLLTSHQQESLTKQENVKKGFIDYIDYVEGVWRVRLKDEREYRAQNIVYSEEPALFLKQIKNKSLFSAKEIELLEAHAYIPAMCLELVGEREFFKEPQTIIIPKSLTHDWGHFILEFKPDKFHVLSYMEEKNSAPEEAEKEWRHLHSTLKRVIDGYNQEAFKEEIFVGKLPTLTFESSSALSENDLMKKCYFINAGAPLDDLELDKNKLTYSSKNLFGLSRSLVSFELFKRNLQ